MASKIGQLHPWQLRSACAVGVGEGQTSRLPAQPRLQLYHHGQCERSANIIDAELSPAGMVGARQSEVTDAISHRAQAAST